MYLSHVTPLDRYDIILFMYSYDMIKQRFLLNFRKKLSDLIDKPQITLFLEK